MTRLARYARMVLLALPALVGCAFDRVNAPVEGSGGSISASVQVAVAAPGAAVGVRFVSTASHFFTVNTCLRRVERMEGLSWVLLPEELRLCAPRVDLVPASSAVTASTDVPLDAVPGEYRFRFSMVPPTGPAVEIATPPFRVE